MFILDSQVPGIYRFDASGRLIARIGRQGEGPGEYSDDITGMIVVGERVFVADAGLGRLSAFSLDGTYQGSFGSVSGLRSLFSPAIAPGPGGGVVPRVLTVKFDPGKGIPTPWPVGIELRGLDGVVVDAIPPPVLSGGSAHLEAGPRGDGVLVDSEEDFLFELRRDNGDVIRVEMPFQLPPGGCLRHSGLSRRAGLAR